MGLDDEQPLLGDSNDEPIGRNPLRAAIDMKKKEMPEKSGNDENDRNHERTRQRLLVYAWGQFILTVLIVIFAVLRIEGSWDAEAREYLDNTTTRTYAYISLGSAVLSLAVLCLEQALERRESVPVFIVKLALSLLHVPWFVYPGNLWLLLL